MAPGVVPFPYLVVHLPQPTVDVFLFWLYLLSFSRALVTHNKKTCCHIPSPTLSRSVVLNLGYTLKSSGEAEKADTTWAPPAEILI